MLLMRPRVLAGLFCLFFAAAAAAQSPCDCTQFIGNCTASAEVTGAAPSQGAFSAGLKLRSSAPICSRIEYFVNDQPHFTLLDKGSIGLEKLTSPRSITQKAVSIEACRVCALATASRPASAPTSAPAVAPQPKPELGSGDQWVDVGGGCQVVMTGVSREKFNWVGACQNGMPSGFGVMEVLSEIGERRLATKMYAPANGRMRDPILNKGEMYIRSRSSRSAQYYPYGANVDDADQKVQFIPPSRIPPWARIIVTGEFTPPQTPLDLTTTGPLPPSADGKRRR